eukprot:5186253-Prymnesium_polylepis.3
MVLPANRFACVDFFLHRLDARDFEHARRAMLLGARPYLGVALTQQGGQHIPLLPHFDDLAGVLDTTFQVTQIADDAVRWFFLTIRLVGIRVGI